MSDLNDRLEESGMPERLYGNPATMFKKTVPGYADIASINVIKNDKVATELYEKVKIKFKAYNSKYKKDLEEWSKKHPELAAEAAKRDAISKERRLEQNRRKTGGVDVKRVKKTSDDSDDEDKKSVDSDEDQPKRKKLKAKKAEAKKVEAKKEKKPKKPVYSSDDSDDDRAYRGSYAKLSKVADGDEMKQMIKVVCAFKDETLRVNTKVKHFESRFAEMEQEGKELRKEVATYNHLVDEVFLKLDEAAFPILKRRKKRNLLQKVEDEEEEEEE